MIKNVLAILGATGLALAPVAAQANTRAADSTVSLSAGQLDRLPASISDSEEIGSRIPFGLLVALFGIAAAIILAAVITDNGGDVIGGPPVSPGTGG